ncbi:MAG: ribonuclease J, partial [Ruminococcaceae bacterium]|nr:ribonuclease J [Oscillospiraceae bacterium]
DAMALAIRTPYGTIVHSGDFKVDFTPILDDVINLRRFSELGDEGVLLFMCDSTNAEKNGHSVSEKAVGESFEKLFSRAENKRVIIASFASNIQRIQQILDLAEAKKRKVAICGRSMENYTDMASKLGYLKIPDGIIIEINELDRYRDKDVVIITTGSQGEPMAALSRMANGSHRQISITKDDFVIISATPIPGNEKMINKVINELLKLGSEVIYETMYDVHASGHACRDEIKLMLNLIKPKYFVPVHGEYKHLKKNIEIALSSGIESENIVMPVIGGVIEVGENSIKKAETVISGRILVDGLGVGDVGSSVLKERKHLSQYGLMVVVCTYDKTLGEFISEPDIISRGFVYAKESDELFEEAKSVVIELTEEFERSKRKKSRNTFKNEIADELSKLMYKRTRRSPMILPIIMEV